MRVHIHTGILYILPAKAVEKLIEILVITFDLSVKRKDWESNHYSEYVTSVRLSMCKKCEKDK